MQNCLREALAKRPDLFDLDDRTLYTQLRTEKRQPTPTDNRLRLAFWMEYDRAQNGVQNMRMNSVSSGVCTDNFFYQHYVTNVHKVAWLLCPPASYNIVMQEALTFGIEQLRDILELPIEVGGKLNVPLVNLKLKIVAMMDLRLKGGIVQKNLNLNVNTGDEGVSAVATLNTMEAIQKRMRELEQRERKALNLPRESSPPPDGETHREAEFVESEVVGKAPT